MERRREGTLMKKLVEIVNDRNAIVEGLDEDRLREEEEDEQLNQLMMNFNLKVKDKSKKKSPISRLFNWSSKDSWRWLPWVLPPCACGTFSSLEPRLTALLNSAVKP